MQAPQTCGLEGCTRERTRHSLFCDEHHEEQLKGVGLLRARPADGDPRAELLRRCARPLKSRQQDVITTDELHGELADVLIHGGVRGESGHWPLCTDALPAGVAEGLLAFLRATTRPHGFFLASPAGVEAARRVQAMLVSELEARLRHAREPGQG